MDLGEILINVLNFRQTCCIFKLWRFPSLTCSLIVISCSICSIWSVVDASVSKPGIKMVDGSSAGFHLSGFGGMGLREVSAILQNAIRHKVG